MLRALARIVSMRLRPESIDNAFDHFRNVSAPLVRAQFGSLGILGAGNRESGFSFAISFWETRADLERSNANPAVVEAMGGYAQWMAGPFLVESYTVIGGALPETDAGDLRDRWLRTTSATALPDRLDDVTATFGERLDGARAASPACVGTLLLAPHFGERVLALELWSSRHALASWDAAAQLEDQRLVRAGGVGQPPVRDTLEVFGRY
jgi:hypothetical protein